MNVDVFSATGAKKGTLALPASLFGARVNRGLMHQALLMQQGNRRSPVAHARRRDEVAGSTRKLYNQKHTGRARRGSIRSPLLRGGGKAFGPRKDANFRRDMPKAMRRAALLSCLSFRAKQGAIVGLENYPETIKTKDAHALLGKLPVQIGRRILFVMPEGQRGLSLSMRNIPRVKTLAVSYLNPEDLLSARHIVFLVDAVKKAEELWGEPRKRELKELKQLKQSKGTAEGASEPAPKKPRKNAAAKKSTKVSSPSSSS